MADNNMQKQAEAHNNEALKEELKYAVSSAEQQAKEIQRNVQSQPARTISSMIGDMVWLMSQSQGHKYLTLVDLEWMVIPPLMLDQYKLYRDEQQRPVGLALWGYLNEDAEKKLHYSGKIAPTDWGNGAEISAEKGIEKKEGGTLWLIDIIAPFNTEDNKQKEKMLVDLINTAFKDAPFKMMRINPETGKKESGWVNEKN